MDGITFEDAQVTYNGAAHSIYISGTLPNGVTVTYDGNAQTEIGNYTVTAIFDVDDPANYNVPESKTATLVINNKITVDMTNVIFAGDAVTYNGAPHSIYVNSATLPSGVTVASYTGNGQINAGEYNVIAIFGVVNPDTHNVPSPMSAILTINKATPDYTIPTGLTAIYGETLEDITLPTGWAWESALTMPVGNAGTQIHNATFTPSNIVNYNIITGIEVSIEVSKATYNMSGISFEDVNVTYNGEPHSILISGTLPTGVTVTYDGNGQTEVGTYEVTAIFAVEDEDNYNVPESMTATLTIAPLIITTYPITVEYGTSDKEEAEAGETVTITADEPSADKIFDKWITTADVTFEDEEAMITTFVMIAQPVTVTATCKDIVQDNILISIATPFDAISGLPNGSPKTVEGLTLPATVNIVTTEGAGTASINWDLEACTYDPTVTTLQTFDVAGTVILPTGITNPNDIPLGVTISVQVLAEVITPAVLSVTVTPATATIQMGTICQFIATVEAVNGADESVTWSVENNESVSTTISATGLLTVAPDETSETLHVKATSVFDTDVFGAASVMVTTEPQPNVLINVTPPAPITGLLNGVPKTVAGLMLPETVAILITEGPATTTVTWDVNGCTYNPALTTEQTFTVTGAITLPSGVTNPNNVSLTIIVRVTVNAQGATGSVLISITAPPPITGLANGVPKTVAGLNLPATVNMSTSNGTGTANVTWNVNACTYNPDLTTAQTFNVAGTVTLPQGVINPNNVSLAVTVRVTVNAGSSIEELTIDNGQLTIYPNPCTTFVIIENAAGADLQITDMTGKTIIQQSIISDTEEINVEELPRDVYMFMFVKDRTIKTLKVVRK
jgi:hypothetical protein